MIKMVKLMISEKGDGKTKRIIEFANETAEKTNGHLVFIDDNNEHMYDLKHDVRFVNMMDFSIKTSDEFFGFICGIISNDYDIDYIFVDGYYKVTQAKPEELSDFIKRLETLADKYNIKFIVTASSASIPEGLKNERI